MALTALDLYNKTDPKKPLPPAQSSSFFDGKLIVSADPRPREPKDIQPGGTHAWYYEDHIYTSIDEKSKYHIAYRAERTWDKSRQRKENNWPPAIHFFY